MEQKGWKRYFWELHYFSGQQKLTRTSLKCTFLGMWPKRQDFLWTSPSPTNSLLFWCYQCIYKSWKSNFHFWLLVICSWYWKIISVRIHDQGDPWAYTCELFPHVVTWLQEQHEQPVYGHRSPESLINGHTLPNGVNTTNERDLNSSKYFSTFQLKCVLWRCNIEAAEHMVIWSNKTGNLALIVST